MWWKRSCTVMIIVTSFKESSQKVRRQNIAGTVNKYWRVSLTEINMYITDRRQKTNQFGFFSYNWSLVSHVHVHCQHLGQPENSTSIIERILKNI